MSFIHYNGVKVMRHFYKAQLSPGASWKVTDGECNNAPAETLRYKYTRANTCTASAVNPENTGTILRNLGR